MGGLNGRKLMEDAGTIEDLEEAASNSVELTF